MIRGTTGNSFDRIAARLTRKAMRLAVTSTSARRLARKGDPAHWRRADLLWPFFTKG